MVSALEIEGFDVVLREEHIHQRLAAQQLFVIAQNRDISELVLLEGGAYAVGVQKLKHAADQGEWIRDVFGKVTIIAKKI